MFGKWYGPFTLLDHAFAGMHHLCRITELHEGTTSLRSGGSRFEHEKKEALLRLDDPDGANSTVVLCGQIDRPATAVELQGWRSFPNGFPSFAFIETLQTKDRQRNLKACTEGIGYCNRSLLIAFELRSLPQPTKK